jgi:hypothetical protein
LASLDRGLEFRDAFFEDDTCALDGPAPDIQSLGGFVQGGSRCANWRICGTVLVGSSSAFSQRCNLASN